MLNKGRSIQLITLLYWIMLGWSRPIFCAEPATPVDWRLSALRKAKEENYYYTLLNVSENDINTAARETPPRDRNAVLHQKMQERIATINAPAPLPPEEASYVVEELQKAAQFLSDPETVRLYNLLGYITYSFIQDSHRALFQALTGKSTDATLKIVARFLQSLAKGEELNEAMADATAAELIARSVTAAVPPQDRIIADSLGGILFENIDSKDKQVLIDFIDKNPPADPDDIRIPYLHNVLKEYIKKLQCKIAATACSKPKPEIDSDIVDEGEPKDTERVGPKPAIHVNKPVTPAAEAPDQDLLKAISLVTGKFRAAQHSLQQAKNHLKSVSPEERAFAKTKIKQALDDNAPTRSFANKLRNSDIPQYKELVQVVDAIYREANSI